MRSPSRVRPFPAAALCALGALLLTVAAPIRVASADAPADGSPRLRAVITLRDQLSGVDLAHRPAAARDAQNAVLASLGGPTPTAVTHVGLANIVSAEVTAAQLAALQRDPRVLAAGPDVTPPTPTGAATTTGSGSATSRVATPGSGAAATPQAAPVNQPPVTVPNEVCSGTAAAPQLEPEALGVMGVQSDNPAVPTARTAAPAGTATYDGSGVTVGVVTTSVKPDAEDFIRADGSHAVVDYQSFSRGGPQDSSGSAAAEGFGDVSSIAAQGRVVYDLASQVSPDVALLPNGHCFIRVVGVAPQSDLVVTNTADGDDVSTAEAVAAIDYSVRVKHVDILSQSFGENIVPDRSSRLAIAAADAAATRAGVAVIVSSGDAGNASTIGNPASDPSVISVGATTTARAYVQTGSYGLTRFGSGQFASDDVSAISSGGFTQTGRTLDVVAPGDGGWASCSTDTSLGTCANHATGDPAPFVLFAGTSQSAPFTAGVAALIVQAYRAGHGGASPSPAAVKAVLAGTATDLGLPADQQGAGRVDALAAVQAAHDLPAASSTGVTGSAALLPADAQISLDGAAGSTQNVRTTLTNTGTQDVVVTPTLTHDVVDAQTHADVTVAPGAEIFAEGSEQGAPAFATRVPVVVPAGRSWAHVLIATQIAAGANGPYVQATAVAPDGTAVAFADSGSNGVELWLPHPDPGTWTLVLGGLVAAGPYTAAVDTEFGRRETVTAAAATTVPAGGQADVDIPATLPADSGDRSWTLRAGSLAVPVSVRTVVDLSSGRATVDSALRPGNGRGGAPAQTVSWDLDVPAGRHDLSVTATPVGTQRVALLFGDLIDPQGNLVSQNVNVDAQKQLTSAAVTTVASDPAAGRWRYVAQVKTDLQGDATSDGRLQVTIATDLVTAKASGVPTGTTPLTSGTTATATIDVTNPWSTPVQIAVDPRLDATGDQPLTPIRYAGPVTLPVPIDPKSGSQQSPVLAVPPFTDRLTVTSTATTPVALGVAGPVTDPDLVATAATTSTVVVPSDVTPGQWTTSLTAPGPLTAPAPGGQATVAATAHTAAFATSVTSSTGDPWLAPSGLAGPTPSPLVLAPGATGQITVSIAAAQAVGTVVSGTLNLVTMPVSLDGLVATGDVLARLPFGYTVTAAPTPPGPTPTPSPVPPSPQGSSVAALPATGADIAPMFGWAAAAVAAGTGLVFAGRRRLRPSGRHRAPID